MCHRIHRAATWHGDQLPPHRPCGSPSMLEKCVVLNAIFSTSAIASSGTAAHRTGARRAQAETSSSQPKIGAYQSE